MSDTLAATIATAIKTLSSQRVTEPPPPSLSFTLRVSKKVDPIFTPRDYPYNDQEHDYIRSLAPFRALPVSLVPTDRNPYPPLMHYGWVISGSLKEQLLRRADSMGHNYVKRLGPSRMNESLSFELALDSIMKELDTSWSSDQWIHLADTKLDRRGALFFNLYTNHDLADLPNGNLPSKEDIEKLCSFFQLAESPAWHPTSLDFEWGDSPLY